MNGMEDSEGREGDARLTIGPFVITASSMHSGASAASLAHIAAPLHLF